MMTINLQVVELEVRNDLDFRPVMKKFGPLVEKGRIVFIRFDDEDRATADSGRHVEILRHPANQISLSNTIFPTPRRPVSNRLFSGRLTRGTQPTTPASMDQERV